MTPSELQKPDAPPLPRPEEACAKCGSVLESQQQKYWHGRRDSVGCIRTLMGMVLDLHARLNTIENALSPAPVDGKDVTP